MENEITTSIGALEGVDLPLLALRAALTCASDEETRYYLNGVYIHAIGDEYRMVATDGHRLFVYSAPVESERQGAELPAWITKGVIVSAEGLKERLALLDKLECGTAHVAYQVASPYIVISDPAQTTTFKVKPVDGTYPDYQEIVDRISFEARELGEMSSISFGTGYLKDVGVLAKLLGAKSARVFGGDSGEKLANPALVTFPENPFAVLLLMPVTQAAPRFSHGVARVLSGAVTGTVAALRAHRTRWSNRLEKATGRSKTEAEKKIADYDKRIAAVLAAVAVPALPAPEPERTPETEVSYAIAQAVDGEQPEKVRLGKDSVDFSTLGEAAQQQIAAELGPDGVKAEYRRGLKASAAKKDRARFYADVNAALGTVSLSQLADGVPIDDWYDAGLTPDEAAKRCGDWRRIGDVLPPDEVQPGEENLPVGLLQSPARSAVPEPEPKQPDEAGSMTISDESAGEIVETAAAALRITKPTRRGKKQSVETTPLEREFEAFCKQVDAIITERKGISLDDLIDCPMRDWFDKGVSPKAAASKAIRFQANS